MNNGILHRIIARRIQLAADCPSIDWDQARLAVWDLDGVPGALQAETSDHCFVTDRLAAGQPATVDGLRIEEHEQLAPGLALLSDGQAIRAVFDFTAHLDPVRRHLHHIGPTAAVAPFPARQSPDV